MKFVPVDVSTFVSVDTGDVRRTFGPAYAVLSGAAENRIGVVWREATVDDNGRHIKTWWWARRTGEQKRIYRESSTRNGAAQMLNAR